MAAQGATWSSPSEESPTSLSPPERPPPPPPPPTSTAVSKSPLGSKASSPSPLLRCTCSEDSLPLAVFYGPLDAKNPLLTSCEKEIRELLGFMRKKKALATTDEQKHEFHRRCATSLFNIWTKYAPRLPADYYNAKLLKVGDSLCQMKEYKLALLQCYGRYLQQFSTNFDENKADVNQFKTVFFPKGFGDKTAGLTFHALNGKNMCNYQLVCDSDVNLQNKESVTHCLHILSSLRLIMQVALPQEHLCWIIYNGTIYIYTICRKLMIIGQSSKALEYLLWASICMESSVPLLSVRYLTWRATLYTAVCQCYYDCQAGIHGEAFARRALAKIEELRQLELMSSSQSLEESIRYYREATIKIAVMIFKRGIFESRRKSKSWFRPKIRVNLREVQTLPWPRTITERLLDEMFDSTASRFLAVLEALSDSNRRILQTGPLATDEVELRDVVSELFMAGKELVIISNTGTNGMLDFPKTPLLQLMIERKNVISVDAAVKFIKLAFTYEEWSLFGSLAGHLICFLQSQDDPESKKAEKDLTLLIAIEPLINVKKNKGLIFPLENSKEGQSDQIYLKNSAFHDACVKTYGYSEDIFHLAATLYDCVCNSPQDVQPDKEIVVDMIMFLWQKCKLGIQKINVSRNDYAKLAQKISTNKWIYLLWQINEVIHCYKMEYIDIVVVAEVTLRLSEILESLGSLRRKLKTSLVLQTPTAGKNISTKGPEKLKQSGSIDCFTELSIMNKIKKNKLSKAIYLMQKAFLIFEKDATSTSSWNFLLEAYSLIEKTEAEQNALYSYQKFLEGSKRKKSRIPPPPILLSRTHCSVTLKPAPFISDVQIPADGKSIFEVKGLETNEKYIFAIAAYSSNGKLIGGAIGETTKPILVYPPLSAVTARMFLTQVAYQIGNYELAKKVFSPVWDYFVASPLQDEQAVICLSNIMTITQRRSRSRRRNQGRVLKRSYPGNEIPGKCIAKGVRVSPGRDWPIARLIECERVLVALELSNFLNDSGYALQAVTQCYGLLAPIIYHNIALVPVVQAPDTLKGKGLYRSCKPGVGVLRPIIIIITIIVIVVIVVIIIIIIDAVFENQGDILRSWKEYDLAVIIINYGKKMLDIAPGCKSLFGSNGEEEMPEEESGIIRATQVRFKPRGLEVWRTGHLTNVTTELSGAEDPIFLYPIVLNWSVKGAMKEVMKFKQQPRFLEFFTQVMLKCMNDERFQLMVEITAPVSDFLK
ncbi:PREDICTED: uncharacterized protein C12orf55, partial [Galeopterus variegatus]|uniref:Uncharacterized protein C12orf55 n=1 Tax=Galeopterus variegatus TaxID=482537 RepID=A0ABM0QFZ7_GALVR